MHHRSGIATGRFLQCGKRCGEQFEKAVGPQNLSVRISNEVIAHFKHHIGQTSRIAMKVQCVCDAILRSVRFVASCFEVSAACCCIQHRVRKRIA